MNAVIYVSLIFFLGYFGTVGRTNSAGVASGFTFVFAFFVVLSSDRIYRLYKQTQVEKTIMTRIGLIIYSILWLSSVVLLFEPMVKGFLN